LIAEVGIAIAGFAGVIAALRSPGGRVKPYAALQIGSLLGQSATVVLVALLPFALHSTGLGSNQIWALSSSLMFLMNLLIILIPFRVASRVLKVAAEDRSPGVRWVAPASTALMVVVCVLQLANAAFIRQLWPLVAGLFALTALSLFMFAYILFAPSRAEVPA
jgi:hypothetical protein